LKKGIERKGFRSRAKGQITVKGDKKMNTILKRAAMVLVVFSANMSFADVRPVPRPIRPPIDQPGRPGPITARELVNLSDRVNRLIDRNASKLDPYQIRTIARHLDTVLDTILGNSGPVYPPTRPISYEAICHVDDDSNFDYGQEVVGKVEGYTLSAVLGECESISNAMYGNYSSFGIKELVPVGRVPSGYRIGECWVDDDANFDFGQFLIGQVVGASIQDLTSQCLQTAKSIFGSVGSSGVKNIE